MKRFVVTFIAVTIVGAVGISPLAQAKGSHGSSHKNYSDTPKEHNVSGYTRKDGTYVAALMRKRSEIKSTAERHQS